MTADALSHPTRNAETIRREADRREARRENVDALLARLQTRLRTLDNEPRDGVAVRELYELEHSLAAALGHFHGGDLGRVGLTEEECDRYGF